MSHYAYDSSSSDDSLLISETSPSWPAACPAPNGIHKVKYHPGHAWDFALDTAQAPVDVTLVLPHYRARNQPLGHRLALFVGNDSGVKVKLARINPQTKFTLDIQGASSDVTVWIPSDYCGAIALATNARPVLSAGFSNKVLPNVRFQRASTHAVDTDSPDDHIEVTTAGRVTFRMWDVRTGSPESAQRETLKRVFGRGSHKPTTDAWDFLLED
ncbi:hypothetical protein CYLTODRAFT_423772 [Cylindrobasidium torrendii FP15055 ss-10]|uniref:DUF7330 domain-containing protein n=1 Tax=Cylindrobasidium torrendii FP15055 ss-10 TaxID=1314674 RepID=A0A0D7B6B3_9AGAR|nr:hypothetical protein CYLTODRAFT_423772 [Cylindrobasidium torrendii FP15055 ss-10]